MARLAILALCATTAASSVDSMITNAERVLDSAQFEQAADSGQRFAVAADGVETLLERYGVYGEMPLQAMAEILESPAVKAIADTPGARFVDFGSGAGRLLLGVAAMGEWASSIGVEALEGLHRIAAEAIRNAEEASAIGKGVVESVHAGVLPHESPTAEILAASDVCFAYSTAFPSEDGLRLPELSASLSCVLREGALVITTDKFLVGERFTFVELVTVEGADGEPIHAFVWRVRGPPAPMYDDALREAVESWMGEDACAQNEGACEALLAALGEDEEGDE